MVLRIHLKGLVNANSQRLIIHQQNQSKIIIYHKE